MTDWQTKSSEIVYETPWFSIRRDEVLNHKDKQLTYSYMELPHPAVTIIAVDNKGRILLQQNHRYTLKQKLWEVPSGHSDGEKPLVAAKRELLEESGLESDDWSDLGEARLACGVADIHHYLFLARNVRTTTTERDEEEPIQDQHFASVEEVKAMIKNNEIVDADTLIGLYRYIFIEKE